MGCEFSVLHLLSPPFGQALFWWKSAVLRRVPRAALGLLEVMGNAGKTKTKQNKTKQSQTNPSTFTYKKEKSCFGNEEV